MTRPILLLLSVSICAVLPVAAQPGGAAALGGYDPVAYFTRNAAVMGAPAIIAMHEGQTYRFSNEENRAAFLKEPAKYVPQFGGQCAWAVSQNYLYPGDPTAFTVYKGRLFLNANQPISKKFNAQIDKLVPDADKNWPGLASKAMKQKDGGMK